MTGRTYNQNEVYFKNGVIKAIDYANDTCSVWVEGTTYTDVRVHYHCSEEMEDEGGSSAFHNGDAVIVLFQVGYPSPREVCGFMNGRTPCRQDYIYFTNYGVQEVQFTYYIQTSPIPTYYQLVKLLPQRHSHVVFDRKYPNVYYILTMNTTTYATINVTCHYLHIQVNEDLTSSLVSTALPDYDTTIPVAGDFGVDVGFEDFSLSYNNSMFDLNDVVYYPEYIYSGTTIREVCQFNQYTQDNITVNLSPDVYIDEYGTLDGGSQYFPLPLRNTDAHTLRMPEKSLAMYLPWHFAGSLISPDYTTANYQTASLGFSEPGFVGFRLPESSEYPQGMYKTGKPHGFEDWCMFYSLSYGESSSLYNYGYITINGNTFDRLLSYRSLQILDLPESGLQGYRYLLWVNFSVVRNVVSVFYTFVEADNYEGSGIDNPIMHHASVAATYFMDDVVDMDTFDPYSFLHLDDTTSQPAMPGDANVTAFHWHHKEYTDVPGCVGMNYTYNKAYSQQYFYDGTFYWLSGYDMCPFPLHKELIKNISSSDDWRKIKVSFSGVGQIRYHSRYYQYRAGYSYADSTHPLYEVES